MKNNWRKYNGALIPNFPPHVNVVENGIEKEIKKRKAFFARWVSNFDIDKELPFWYIIKDNATEIESYSSNTRTQIRKGLKNFRVRIVDRSVVKGKGFEIYESSFKSYKGAQKMLSEEQFKSNLDENFQYWGVYTNDNLFVGYAMNRVYNDVCDYSTIKIHPGYLQQYPIYALFFEMNRYYLNELNMKYVSDGARSISHQTNIQDFLIKKFKFRKAYCKLHIIYNPVFGFFVDVIFSLRGMFKFFTFNKVEIILKQEEIRRNCNKKESDASNL
jgi:hypothetical protein